MVGHSWRRLSGQRKGQFTKKSTSEWLKNVQATGILNKGRNVRKIETPKSPKGEKTPTRRRVVEYSHLGKELWCKKCKIPLSLEFIEGEEKQCGLAFVSYVRCFKCRSLNKIESCKSNIVNKNRQYDANCKLVLGAVDAGLGNTAVNTFLSALNIPPITTSLYRRHEQKVGPIIEEVAHESCVENIKIEKELTLKDRSLPPTSEVHSSQPQSTGEKPLSENTEIISQSAVDSSEPQGTAKIALPERSCDELVSTKQNQNISTPEDTNSHTGTETHSCNGVENSESTTPTSKVCLLASTDGAWHKRAAGRSYNSLSGHNSLIGHFSQRLLGFSVRSKICKNFWCRKGSPSPTHKCRKNWSGSAKAMEPDMTVELTAKNRDLEKENCYIGVLIGDDDSSSIAAVRRESQQPVKKYSDISHAKRALGKALIGINVDPKIRLYLIKCFMLTIRRNKNMPLAVRGEMRNIVNHTYGEHTDCRKWGGNWCNYANDPENYKHKGLPKGEPLSKLELRGLLTSIFERFAKNADKLAPCASSQSNEAFNNTVASKNSKRQCFAGSESVFTRVAAAAAQKNLGTSYITKCNELLKLSPGDVSKQFRAQQDSKRARRSEEQKTVEYKRKRLNFQLERSKKTDAAERKEGVTYSTGCDIDGIAHLVDDPAVQINLPLGGDAPLIFVDLETTCLSRHTAEVCQIGGKCGENEFGVYIVPQKPIPPMVSNLTGLTVEAGQLFFNGDAVPTTPPQLAWASFLTFIKAQGKSVILVAHNGFRYDFPIIMRCLKACNLLQDFSQVVQGFADTLTIFKGELKGMKSFKQSTLAEHFKISNPLAHNAVGDVRVLQELIAVTKITKEVVLRMCKPVSWVISNEHRLAMKPGNVQSMECLKPAVSVSMINKIASCGLSLKSIQEAFLSGGENSVLLLLGEDVGGKPRVTKQKKIIGNITAAVQKSLIPSEENIA